MKTTILLAILFINIFAQAEDKASGNIFDRASKREGSRWTLTEWLAQKERNKLMDMWLAMNTPSPYEFMIGSSYNSYKTTKNLVSTEYTTYNSELQAYAKFFGLGLEYENRNSENENDFSGMLNIRLLGNSIQSTHLSIHYGQRTRTISDVTATSLLRNQFGQVSLQLYLNPYFGINGKYRQYLSFNDSTYGDVTGQLTSGAVFIEFKALRIFGEWFEDIQKNTGASVPAEIKRNGIKTGIQLFF
jgi:hypothetical protein